MDGTYKSDTNTVFEVLAGAPTSIMRTREAVGQANGAVSFSGVGRRVLVGTVADTNDGCRFAVRRRLSGVRLLFDGGHRGELSAQAIAPANDNMHFVSIIGGQLVFNTTDSHVLPEFED